MGIQENDVANTTRYNPGYLNATTCFEQKTVPDSRYRVSSAV